MKEEEDDDDERTNGFEDWVHYRHTSPPPVSSSSSSSSSSHLLSPTHHHGDLTIFPPVNHEGLTISHSIPTPILDSDPNSSSPHPPSSPRNSQLVSWFDLALHLWNSKLVSMITHVRSPGFLSSLRPLVAVGSILAGLWFWVWRRRKKSGGGERVERLKLLIKEKDEILQLLEQIAKMNKALLTQHRIPVLKSN